MKIIYKKALFFHSNEKTLYDLNDWKNDVSVEIQTPKYGQHEVNPNLLYYTLKIKSFKCFERKD